MAHRTREKVSRHHPVHVTIRLISGLPSLRRKRVAAMIRDALHKMLGRKGFKIVAYTIQTNHLHLIVECGSRKHLANGMKAIQVRIARGVNRLWERSGRVFRDRYHDHVLKTPSEVRRALCYVLNNHYKHGHRAALGLDYYASGAWFGGWRQKFEVTGTEGMPLHVPEPGTWLLRIGWRRRGLISLDEAPPPNPMRLPAPLKKLLRKRRQSTAKVRG